MTRVKGGPRARNKHRSIIKLAKGYRGTRSKLFRRANEAVLRAGEHAFAGRRIRRRDMRKLWISRISGALTQHEINYSTFMHILPKTGIVLNRKMLSEIAINDPKAFEEVVNKVKAIK
ncbi:50S ribosomal protein L20 [Candidatus Nomurabacteria bacterium]|uniref:Large ribosomal subunit protein bL20 n=1 Tax=candidate division WWE3 bacterium TaxID=2053526 RepID=A0A955E1K8_UNCKA|nr:50S ribosomal protein L20 [candidate division WWE3 bacterium]MCB9823747.1 50S ribosomal protein L20 [Candidatus Nomurabacteria bacterium]MCB9827174.1 50S ribosomal protein L20 [Candidatus Nomurabacteria bacterium]MCB9827542.1 50S ribosomal protein L20 [Candidatus Nomurabacteria bacterium]HXK52581.1 50S ribosomal protein L20 [bacterium]